MTELLTIAVENNVGGSKVDAVLMVVGCGVEWQVGDDVVPTAGSVVTSSNGFLGLQDEVDGEGLILEVKLGREELHINLLRVIIVLVFVSRVIQTSIARAGMASIPRRKQSMYQE